MFVRGWAVLVAASFLGGCVGDDGVATGDDQYQTEEERQLSEELTEKYGLRPRRYGGFFDGSNEAEERFLAHLPEVTAELNEIIESNGYDYEVTQAELATNFITEGGYYLLEDEITDTDWEAEIYIDGFRYLGVDTFVDNLEALDPWLTDGLYQAYVDEELASVEVVNELGQTVTTVVVPDIERGLEANAVVFAWSRAILSNDLASEGLSAPRDLAYEARFFWTTVYFNAGPGFGGEQLVVEGIDWWQDKWTLPDDHAKYSGYARYNALWRTSSFEYMALTELGRPI